MDRASGALKAVEKEMWGFDAMGGHSDCSYFCWYLKTMNHRSTQF